MELSRPLPEIPKIENLVAFFNERVDIIVAGVPQDPQRGAARGRGRRRADGRGRWRAAPATGVGPWPNTGGHGHGLPPRDSRLDMYEPPREVR